MKYFVTTIGFYSTVYKASAGERHSRCVGYFDTFEDAEAVVLENHGDIYECGFYTYAAIEEMKVGLYPHDIRMKWYKAEWVEADANSRYKVELISTPEFAKHTLGWSIG
jgi:hypothetical protein